MNSTFETEEGTIEYREMNPIDLIRFKGQIGIAKHFYKFSNHKIDANDTEKLLVETGDAYLILQANILENIGPFVSKVKFKIEDKEVNDWPTLLQTRVASGFLEAFANHVFVSLVQGGDDTKKKG